MRSSAVAFRMARSFRLIFLEIFFGKIERNVRRFPLNRREATRSWWTAVGLCTRCASSTLSVRFSKSSRSPRRTTLRIPISHGLRPRQNSSRITSYPPARKSLWNFGTSAQSTAALRILGSMPMSNGATAQQRPTTRPFVAAL